MKKSILVIAAHPDDEILGCAGTIAKHCKAGDEVRVVVLAEGITSRAGSEESNKLALAQLSKSAHAANAVLGIKELFLEAFPDNRMDSIDMIDIIRRVEFYIDEFKPSIVYTHWRDDLNIDHKLIHQAVVTATRPQPGQVVKELYFFEVNSSTEWQFPTNFFPNLFVDITNTLELKLKALDCYSSEMRAWPHARSVKAVEYLSKWRGGTIGVEAAETFHVGRIIS